MSFGPAYMAHTPPVRVWYSRDSLCCGYFAGAAACGVWLLLQKAKKKLARHVWLELRHLKGGATKTENKTEAHHISHPLSHES